MLNMICVGGGVSIISEDKQQLYIQIHKVHGSCTYIYMWKNWWNAWVEKGAMVISQRFNNLAPAVNIFEQEYAGQSQMKLSSTITHFNDKILSLVSVSFFLFIFSL